MSGKNSGLYDRYFNIEKRGKSYSSEKEYLGEVYSFVDMCFAGLSMLYTADGSSDEKNSERNDATSAAQAASRTRIRELYHTTQQAYDALLGRQQEPDAAARAYIKEQLICADAHIRERLLFTPLSSMQFKMRLLIKRMALTPFEAFLLYLGYAATYDEKYSALFADIQGNTAKTQPTLKLAILLYTLYAETDEAEIGRMLEWGSPLLESFFDIKKEDTGQPENYGFACNRRTCAFLRGYDDLDRDVKRFASYIGRENPLDEVIVRQEEAKKVMAAVSRFLNKNDGKNKNSENAENNEIGNVLHIYGPSGNGKRLFIQRAAAAEGYGVIYVSIDRVEAATFEEVEICLARLIQESILLNAVLCFIDDKDREEEEAEEGQYRQRVGFPKPLSYFIELLSRRLPFFIWISPEKSRYLLRYPLHLFCMELPMLSAGERIILWESFSKPYQLDGSMDLALCANKYILSVRGIKEVLRAAELIRLQEGGDSIKPMHIRLAVRQQSPNQLGRFATLINAVYTWEDLVVSPEQVHQMKLICNQLKYRNIVGEEWGFYRKTAYGRGICALFYGAPGTGKTMAVQVMANELGLDLYRVDLSQMVSKYIGETEKNISELFKKAKNLNALLFFDEADSLFAKRLEVKDAHDRNANAETAHLLQKLEDYEGIAILATNYVNNIDDAFKRRIKFMVNFSFPTPEVRLELWHTILPKQVPFEEEIDFEYYAGHFELSGSSIKEILTNASFIAASQGEHLANRHIIEAIKLNFAKYGKVLTDDDFGYLVLH